MDENGELTDSAMQASVLELDANLARKLSA